MSPGRGRALRSLLFVPGDSQRKLDRALSSGADALILDLEDAVAMTGKEAARRATAEWLAGTRLEASRPTIFVRVNGLRTGLTAADLAAVLPNRPDGIVLPKAEGAREIQELAAMLEAQEVEAGWPSASTAILPIATETARGLLAIGSIPGSTGRLTAVTWGGEDLAADLGAESNRDETGGYADPYRYARTMTLVAAAASEVDAIDSVFTDFRDREGLRQECLAARRDGFAGKLAIHPDQVPVINDAFTPPPEALSAAREIVEALAAAGGGVATLRGRMLDRPHLRMAERTLARAPRSK